MRWIAKAAVQKALSATPWAESLNFQLSKRLLRSYPQGDGALRAHFEGAVAHAQALERHGSVSLPSCRAYEFGAGWDLASPLALWTLGVDRQTPVDLDDHLRFELVEHARQRFTAMHEDLEALAGRPLRRLPERPITARGDLDRLGIDFRAPFDARSTPFDGGSFDLVTSTFTLEHIPAPDIVAIFRESARLMAPGAVMSNLIDCQDHYSFVDDSISVYNYLRFSDRAWRLINCDLHHQNRLRVIEHVALHEDADLAVLASHAEPPDPEQVRRFDQLTPAPRFARFSRDELLPPSVHVIAARG